MVSEGRPHDMVLPGQMRNIFGRCRFFSYKNHLDILLIQKSLILKLSINGLREKKFQKGP